MNDTVRAMIITRFSILIEKKAHSWHRLRDKTNPLTWFRPKNPSLEEKIAYLFDPARLDARFDRFERMLLPSVAAQTVPVEHLVLTSETLPAPYMDRLRGLSDRFGFRLHAAGTDRFVHDILTEDRLAEFEGADRLATIRVDDDDAIATTLTERVVDLSRLDLDDYVITFPNGIFVDERTTPPSFSRVWRPATACGLTRVIRAPNPADTIYGAGNHNKLGRSYPFLQIPDEDMFLMTAHDDTISHRLRRRRLKDAEPVSGDAAAFLHKRFGIASA